MKQVKNIGRLFLLFGIIVCFNRCEKDKLVGSNNGNIHVRQYKTGVAIAGAKLIVTKGNLSSGVGTIPVDTLYTDADGNATYTGEIDNSYFYYAEAYRDNYFDTHNNQASLTSGKANIVMYANSYVKLHVRNVNPFHQYDLLQIGTSCNSWNQMIISLKNFGSDNKYILIYDCLGNVVKDFGSTSKNEIEENVSNYTKGIYLVKAVSGKQVLTTKFVVN